MSEITLEGVSVEREGRRVLDVPSLVIRGGRITAVLGPNGAGKSTLLRVIAGLQRHRTGVVRIDGSAPRDLAFVFQEQVFLRQSVRDNLELGLRLRRVDAAERRRRIDEAVSLLGVAHLLDRRADHLSGGEGRRVSLARALSLRAPLVLLDEPLAGLDEQGYTNLIDELPRILAAFDATTLFVTHNRNEALRLAEDVVVLVAGAVHAAGDKRSVAAAPATAEVATVLGYVVLDAGGRRVAVRPQDLGVRRGALEFSLIVDEVVELIEWREIMGRIGGRRVRIRVAADDVVPAAGSSITVATDRFVDVTA